MAQNYATEIYELQLSYEPKFNLIQDNFNTEVAKLKLSNTSKRNELWNKSYQSEWGLLLTECNNKAIEIYNKYH